MRITEATVGYSHPANSRATFSFGGVLARHFGATDDKPAFVKLAFLEEDRECWISRSTEKDGGSKVGPNSSNNRLTHRFGVNDNVGLPPSGPIDLPGRVLDDGTLVVKLPEKLPAANSAPRQGGNTRKASPSPLERAKAARADLAAALLECGGRIKALPEGGDKFVFIKLSSLKLVVEQEEVVRRMVEQEF